MNLLQTFVPQKGNKPFVTLCREKKLNIDLKVYARQYDDDGDVKDEEYNDKFAWTHLNLLTNLDEFGHLVLQLTVPLHQIG